jgi:hypothetical protein
MKKATFLLLLVILIFAGVVSAQDKLGEIINEATAQLQSAKSADEAIAITTDLLVDLKRLRNEANETHAGTYTDPVPLGEYFVFDAGKFRVVSYTDNVDPTTGDVDMDDGHRLIAFDVEFVCEPADPDEECRGGGTVVSSIIKPDGFTYENTTAYVYSAPNDAVDYMDLRAFGGATLRGMLYAQVPIDMEFGLVEIFIYGGSDPRPIFSVN